MTLNTHSPRACEGERCGLRPCRGAEMPDASEDVVLFGYMDRSVLVSQEAYAIFLERERGLEAQVQALGDEVERLRALTSPLSWVPVSERLPEPGTPVLVFVPSLFGAKGSGRRLRAQYAADRTLEHSTEHEGGIYDEEMDTYWCEPGWYETNEYEEVHWGICDEPSHWMPLPDAPAQGGGK